MQMHRFCSGAARLCVTRLVFMITQPSLLAPMCETAGVEQWDCFPQISQGTCLHFLFSLWSWSTAWFFVFVFTNKSSKKSTLSQMLKGTTHHQFTVQFGFLGADVVTRSVKLIFYFLSCLEVSYISYETVQWRTSTMTKNFSKQVKLRFCSGKHVSDSAATGDGTVLNWAMRVFFQIKQQIY